MKKRIYASILSFLMFFMIFEGQVYAISNELDLSCKSAIVMNIDTGEVLYEYNSEEKMQMASTTKIMTALLLAENCKENDKLLLSNEAMSQPSTSVYKDLASDLKENTVFTAKDTMMGMMLKSGNDMAIMTAQYIAGDTVSFSKMMDNRAKKIGMANTDFYTPTGLDRDEVLNGESHYSTAYDMALLGIEAFNNDWVRETMGLSKATIYGDSNRAINLENSNKNLGENGCIGGKTGYTTKAGRCLVAFYERAGQRLVGVVLDGSLSGFFDDMNKIMDFSFNQDRTEIVNSAELEYSENFVFRPFRFFGKKIEIDMPLKLKDSIYGYNNEYNKINTKYEYISNNCSIWGLKKDSVVGKLIVKEKNNTKEYDVYSTLSTVDIVKDNIWLYFKYIVLFAISVFIFKLVYKCIKKNKRM